MPRLAIPLIGLLMGLLAACSTTRPASIDRGRFVVLRACAGCHAIGVDGDSPNPAAPALRDVALHQDRRALEQELGQISQHGHVQMPPIYMTPDEIRDIAIYISNLPSGGAEPLPATRPAAP